MRAGSLQHGAMLRGALLPLVDLIYPPRCPACGDPLAAQDGLCVTCWNALARPEGPLCSACARPLKDDIAGENALCAVCMADPPQHDGIAAAALYCPIARKLVLNFKYGRRLGLSSMMARMIVANLPELEGEWLVMPVPLHWSRLWRRGYNQSALLAARVARSRGYSLLVDGLTRRKMTPPLGGLGKAARARTMRGAITINKRRPHAVRGANVLLVDDVLTSGATTNACVAVLKRAGAKNVMIACFARVAG